MRSSRPTTANDGLRLSGLDPAGIFLGKAGALAIQLLVLEVVLALVASLLYGAPLTDALVLVVTCVVATLGLAAVGTLYGALALGARVRETLLPLLFFPVVAPVLIGAMKAWQAGSRRNAREGRRLARAALVFAVAYVAIGTVPSARCWRMDDYDRVARPSDDPPRPSVRSAERALRVVGVLVALVGVVATVWLGLWVTPPDQFMGNLVRLLYIHPPMAWVAFLAYGLSLPASLAYLWPRTRALVLDRLAGASAEVGVVFTGLTLVTGSIWGRPTWGTWWTWDPLLTTTALLFVLYLGYLAHPARAGNRRGAGQAERDRRAGRLRRRAGRVLLGLLVAEPAPDAVDPEHRDEQDDGARLDGLDAAARVLLVHPRLHLARRPALPPRRPARPGKRRPGSRSRSPSVAWRVADERLRDRRLPRRAALARDVLALPRRAASRVETSARCNASGHATSGHPRKRARRHDGRR